MLKAIRIGALVLALLLALGTGLLLVHGERLFGRSQQLTGLAQLRQLGGPFALTTHRGERFTEADLKGKPTLMFFGFTHCPDVCPTALTDMTARLKELGPDGDRLRVLFVSVDPERDTRELMATYLESFDPRITALTGSRAEVDQIMKAYAVFAEKVQITAGGYNMNHTASTYMLGRDAAFRGMIDPNEAPEMVLAKMKRLIAE